MRMLKGAFPFSGLSLVSSLFSKPKTAAGPPGAVQRDEARDAALRNDELLRRRGGAADIVTGAYGAEAGRGGATTLGS